MEIALGIGLVAALAALGAMGWRLAQVQRHILEMRAGDQAGTLAPVAAAMQPEIPVDDEHSVEAVEAPSSELTPEPALVEVEAIEGPPSPDRYELLEVGPPLQSALGPILDRAPVLAHAGAGAAQGVYILRFAPEATAALKDGSLALMKAAGGGVRANAANSAGRIGAQGTLHGADAFRAASAALAAWQVLAIVTAQKFLSDINKRLANIEKGVKKIHEWLENDRIGQLEAAFAYAKETAHALRTHAFNEQELEVRVHELESHDSACRQVMRAVEREMGQLKDDLSEELASTGDLDDSRAELTALAERVRQLGQTYLYAAHIRGLAAQLRCSLPASREASLQRLEGLQAEAESFESLRKATVQQARSRLSEVKGTFTFDETDKDAQKQLRAEIGQSEKVHKKLYGDVSSRVSEALDAGRLLLRHEREGVVLVAERSETGMLVNVWQKRTTTID